MTLTMIPRGWLITNLTIVILNPEVTRAMGQNRSSLIPFCILAAGLGLFGLSGNSPVLGEDPDEAWEMALRHDNLRPNNIFAVDLNVKWKPIGGGVAHRREAALKHRAAAMIRRLEDARSKVSLEVRRAWLTLEEKRQGIDVARMALEQAKENLRITRNQYRHGVGTSTEVLQAETLRTESRKNDYNAIYDAARSEFELKRAAGIL